MTDNSPIDVATIETLKGLMKDSFIVLIDTFISGSNQHLEDLNSALRENNTDDIISILHAVKGSAASVGATAMHEKAKDFENKARAGDLKNNGEWAEQLAIEFDLYKKEIQNHL